MPLGVRTIRFEDYAMYQMTSIFVAGMTVVDKKQMKSPQLHQMCSDYFEIDLADEDRHADRPKEITVEMMRLNGKGELLNGPKIWDRFNKGCTLVRNVLLPAWNSMIGPDGKLPSGIQWEEAVLKVRQ
eukprot:2537393-Rhodomonas_salina.1